MNLSSLYQIRGVISNYAKKYEMIFKIGLKYIAFFVLFRLVAGAEIFSGQGMFNSLPVHLILALVATLLPSRIGVLLTMALVIYNVFQSSLIGAVIVGGMMLVLYIAVSRMFPDQVYFLVLIPVCIQWNLYLLFPLFAGLYVGLIAVVPVVAGVLLWGLIRIIPAFMTLEIGESLDALPKMISDASTYGIDQITKNDQMVYLLIISTGIIILVSLLKKLKMDYVRYIALAAGGILGIVCLIMGTIVGSLPGNLIVSVLWGVLSMGGIALMEFMHLAVNYKAAQNLEFEDEEYYYQVRAIPKINPISKSKKEVKTITEVQKDDSNRTRMDEWTKEPGANRRPQTESGRRSKERAENPNVKPLRKRSEARVQMDGQSVQSQPKRAAARRQAPVNRSKDDELEDLFKE